jgi:hypothetical protein
MFLRKNGHVPLTAGVLAAAALLSVYLGTLTLLQSPAHAWEQLTSDGFWVGLVALGFGVQVGLYAFMRALVHVAKASGATAVTGAGTGTSTLGMLACCAHHVSDVAPLIALTGAGGLSGAIGFLTEWKFAFIGLGLAMNVVGILITWRILRECLAHHSRSAAESTDTQSVLACH